MKNMDMKKKNERFNNKIVTVGVIAMSIYEKYGY